MNAKPSATPEARCFTVLKYFDMQKLYAFKVADLRGLPIGELSVSNRFIIYVNGREVSVSSETSVAAAMMMANQSCRKSVRGELRGPFCGMGICMECRAEVNGIPHQRTCQLQCVPGMAVVTE